MRVTIEAKLRGPDSLAWPVEPGYAPRWMPNYGEFTGPLDTPEGAAVLKAWRDGTELFTGRPGWRVVEFSMKSEDV